MYEQLLKIVANAAELSEKLHVQRCRFFVAGLRNLPEKFDSTSRHMEAHSAHIVELEDDERCLDGRDILLVVHPEIIAYGSSDGTDASTVRVLKKAVVWMGKY